MRGRVLTPARPHVLPCAVSRSPHSRVRAAGGLGAPAGPRRPPGSILGPSRSLGGGRAPAATPQAWPGSPGPRGAGHPQSGWRGGEARPAPQAPAPGLLPRKDAPPLRSPEPAHGGSLEGVLPRSCDLCPGGAGPGVFPGGKGWVAKAGRLRQPCGPCDSDLSPGHQRRRTPSWEFERSSPRMHRKCVLR